LRDWFSLENIQFFFILTIYIGSSYIAILFIFIILFLNMFLESAKSPTGAGLKTRHF